MAHGDKALVELGNYLKHRGYKFVSVTPATHRLINDKSDHKAGTLASLFGWSRSVAIDEMRGWPSISTTIASDGIP